MSPSTDPTVFNLGSLGWKAFQDLSGTVLSAVLGQTVVAFRPTRDGGRDFAFEGKWHPIGGEALAGAFVVQCKFKANGVFYPSDLKEDLTKIGRLVASGRCGSYILMTNGVMTATTDATVARALRRRGVAHVHLIGGDLLDKYIRENPGLRALVPRLYGLGDLTQILDERRYQQASALLASMREDISKFVITEPYRQAITALLDHGFVLLLGAPAAGKSMIASALAAASIDMWGSRPMKLEGVAAFAAAWNPLEPNQFLWIDDAFGVTQYQRQRADEWNQLLPHVRAAVARGTKIVVTSRDYIWAEAVRDLKTSVFPALASGQVVVDVHDLSPEDKRQILYNHLKYGGQPSEFRSAVKPFSEAVVAIDEFLPEVARRFGDPQLTARVRPTQGEVLRFFEEPVEHLTEVVGGLGADEFAALTLLYMSQGVRQSPIELSEPESSALSRLGSDLAGVITGLSALRGSLVVLTADPMQSGEETWVFRHPTIGEAIQRQIAVRRELLQIYLLGCPVTNLLNEITCGDVGLAQALVVPSRYFGEVARRLHGAIRSRELAPQLADFLTTRCSQSFLAAHGRGLASLTLDATDSGTPRRAARLNDHGLLGEETRKALISRYHNLALEQLDLRAIEDEAVRALATKEELEALITLLRAEVVGGLSWVLALEEREYDGSESPDSVGDRIRDILSTLADLYADDAEVAEAVSDADAGLDELVADLEERWHGDIGDDDYDGWRDRFSAASPSDSGVFADVDE